MAMDDMATREKEIEDVLDDEDAVEDEYDDDYDDYDDEEDDDGGLSGLVVLLMGVVMLGAFAAVVWIAYQQGMKTGDTETPYVAADPEPVKIAQADDGATSASREVYDSLNGRPPEPVEIIAEGPEEPIERGAADPIGAIAAGAAAAEGAAGDALDVVEDAVADRIEALEAAEEAASETAGDAATRLASAAQDLRVPAPNKETIDQKPLSVPPAPAVEPTPAPSTPSASSTSSGGASAMSGTHVVQVGAFRSQAEADGYWTKMAGKLGGYLDRKGKDVQRADLGAKGVYYRLRIGPFESVGAARSYCAGLKERGQDCIAKAK